MSNFFDEINYLKQSLNESIDPKELFKHEANVRFSEILNIQSKYFDEELKKLDNSINWDFSNIENIKVINKILNNIYKVISYDRLSILDNLVDNLR